jgi:putative spermidine/putrescine transport system permease protein
LEEAQGTLLVGFPQIKTMPVELYGVIMEYPLTAGPVLSLILIIPTILILFVMRKYINADNLSQGYGMK